MRRNANQGFTLIELMIVILILGILAAIAIPNFMRMQDNARRASCISNQRHTCEQAIVYAWENSFSNGNLSVTDIFAAGLLQQNVCECPKSGNNDYDDYSITFAGGYITVISCDVYPVEHAYTFTN